MRYSLRRVLVSALLVVLMLGGCSSRKVDPSADLVGSVFPTVAGESLDGSTVIFPSSVSGKPTLLLIGYVQKAQFDIDRWLYAVLENQLIDQVFEVPTIAGMVPSILKERINQGMRSGIPQPDWSSVVTVYDDATKIMTAIGNNGTNNCHAVLLDRDGRIVWTHNSGFSPRVLLELKARLTNLSSGE